MFCQFRNPLGSSFYSFLYRSSKVFSFLDSVRCFLIFSCHFNKHAFGISPHHLFSSLQPEASARSASLRTEIHRILQSSHRINFFFSFALKHSISVWNPYSPYNNCIRLSFVSHNAVIIFHTSPPVPGAGTVIFSKILLKVSPALV